MKTFKRILKVAFMTIMCIILGLVLMLFFAFNLGGYEAIQINGDEMSPELKSGEVIILKPTSINDVEVGDIITYRLGYARVTHQVVGKSEDKLTTKAVNSDNIDVVKVTSENLQGKMLTKLSDGKDFVLFITNPVNMVVILLIVMVIIAVPIIMKFSKLDNEIKDK